MFDFILRPFKVNFGKDKQYYKIVDGMFGFIPNNIELYKLALIHKSASLILDDGRQMNNERLEFLGDAIIEAISSDYLYIEYPECNEGFLTKLRSKIVSRVTLNEVAKSLNLQDHIISNSSGNIIQKHICGDAFEALIGAIYLDQGYDFTNRLLINNIFVHNLDLSHLKSSETDFKSRLIEWAQKNHHEILFKTINAEGYTSNRPQFSSTVIVDKIEIGHGYGESKKEAEQRAAYSVSQAMSDATCASILDKIDLLEEK